MAGTVPGTRRLPAAWVYTPLLRLLFPLVWLVNLMANAVLRLLRIFPEDAEGNALSREELRTVVNEAGAMIPKRHQKMLLNILDLERSRSTTSWCRAVIDGVDLDNPFDVILEQLEKIPIRVSWCIAAASITWWIRALAAHDAGSCWTASSTAKPSKA